MDDPLDYVDITDVAVHGDPGKWRFQVRKQGSPTAATSLNAPPGTMKHYDLYLDEFGTKIELHYFRYADGTVDDVKVRPHT